MTTRRRARRAWLTGGVLLLAATAHADDEVRYLWRGPLPVRSQFQLELPLLALTPQSATPLSKGAWTMDVLVVHANTLQATPNYGVRAEQYDAGAHAAGYDFLLDSETTRLSVRGAVGLGRRWEVSAELPVIAHRAGFLDHFIDEFHDAFGFDIEDRAQEPENQLDLDVIGGSRRKRVDSPTTAFGDLVVGAKFALIQREHAFVSMLLEAKAPIGDESSFAGSGRWDAGATLLVSAGTRHHAFHGGLGHVILGQPRDWPMSVSDVTSLFAGYEWRHEGPWSITAHVQVATSFLPHAEDSLADQERILIVGGARREGRRGAFTIGICEDASDRDNSADVGLVLGWQWRSRDEPATSR